MYSVSEMQITPSVHKSSRYSVASMQSELNAITPVVDSFESVSVSMSELDINNDNGRVDEHFENRITFLDSKMVVQSTANNKKSWFNLFAKIATQKGVQYHWRLKVLHFNPQWLLMIGVIDVMKYSEFLIANQQKRNTEYFAKSMFGYGIDSNGNLKHGGKNCGQYCQPIKSGDIVDVYFDMRSYAIWFGLNDIEYNVAYKVHKAFFKLAISMFGHQHAVQILSCDVYCYKKETV